MGRACGGHQYASVDARFRRERCRAESMGLDQRQPVAHQLNDDLAGMCHSIELEVDLHGRAA